MGSVTCGQCGAPLPRADIRFCTRCGAPTGQPGSGAQPGGGGYAPPGQPPYPQPPYPQPGPYGQPQGQPPYPQPQYPQPGPYGPPPGGEPPGGEPPRPGPKLGPILVGAALILVVLGGVAVWLMSRMDDPPIPIGRAAPTATPTPVPTPTRAPGIGINIPGPQGTPTTVTIPLPIPGLGANATPGAPQLPITIPGLGSGSPGIPALPGASGTQPPNAKLTADTARQKVKDTLTNCRLLQAQIEASQVTFEPPTWLVRLPLSGATWRVDDESGAVTPDERAAERARTCRL